MSEKTFEDIINDLFEDVSSDLQKSEGESEDEKKKKKDGKVVNSASATPSNADDLSVGETQVIETNRSDFPEQINSFDESSGAIHDKDYSSIQPSHEASDIPEASQVKPLRKSDTIEISKEDFELLKAAKASKEKEALEKARTEQADLIKSVITSVVADQNSKIDSLEKGLTKLTQVIGKIATMPKDPKAITSMVETIEKSNPETGTVNTREMMYKSANRQLVLDTAIELAGSGNSEFIDEHVFEVENSFNNPRIPNGTIWENPRAQYLLDEAVSKKLKS